MARNAWTFQKADDVRDLGEDNSPWCVGWYEPDGRRRSRTFAPGATGKRDAEKFAKRTTSELMTGTYHQNSDVTWDAFAKEYESRILSGLEAGTRQVALACLANFKRLMKPVKVSVICTAHIDDFVSRRRKDRGQKRGSEVSPATVNKNLRHLKAALNVAVEWGYLKTLPRFRMEKAPKKLIRYVTGEHFAAIYQACDVAKYPMGLPFPAADWWRGLITFIYMTGWRIGDMLSLRREDLDLDTGHAVTCHEDNKGDQDARIKLHPAVVEHLRKIPSFDPMVFPWHHGGSLLSRQFHRIQTAAGLHIPCHRRHEHSKVCHCYGFHDLRRAFATVNAPRLTADSLQKLMRHKSYSTTQLYINMASQVEDAVNLLHVPEFLRPESSPEDEREGREA